ncbi:hypothetical protein [Pedobacter sp. UYP1]|uniref:hypothetical protein n=1 Tax=Pedobacter sp. UYP1 TaxID=1756396 RepID=UPI00339666CE
MARRYGYNEIGDPLLPSSYNIAPTTPLCVNGWKFCAILSPGTSTPAAFFVMLTRIEPEQTLRNKKVLKKIWLREPLRSQNQPKPKTKL